MARFELVAWGPDFYADKLCERIAELGPSEFLNRFAATDTWATLDSTTADEEPGHDNVDTYQKDEWILLWSEEARIVGLAKDTEYQN
jgi:hypothetical protein